MVAHYDRMAAQAENESRLTNRPVSPAAFNKGALQGPGTKSGQGGIELNVEEFEIKEEPFYLPIGDEVEVFESAYKNKIPVVIKGPTGCGKTRFVEHMAYRLKEQVVSVRKQPEEGFFSVSQKDYREGTGLLVTVPCHEDLTSSDLAGRFLMNMKEGVYWVDGPLATAVRYGGICYLDEVVEARNDVTVLIHSLTDYRRMMPLSKKGTVLKAPDNFMLVMSYNPGYQSVLKDMKQSTRQRFIFLEFDYPSAEHEIQIVLRESNCHEGTVTDLVHAGNKIRRLKSQGLSEGVSTRLLIYAARLIAGGIHRRKACEVAIANALTDDADMKGSIMDIFRDYNFK